MNDNKLIAEFMGFSYEKNIGYYDNEMLLSQCVYDLNGGNCFDELLFHDSWDWLMPVVSKCHKIDESSIRLEIGHKNMYGANRELVYEAVVEFIKEFNLKS